jgi:hypothetical protein
MALSLGRRSCAITVALLVLTSARGWIGRCSGAETVPAGGAALPCRLPEQKDPKIRAVQDRVYRLAQIQARYLLGKIRPWSEDPGLLLLTESKSLEHFIRPNTTTVEGLSFLCRFGPYDESLMGVSREMLWKKTIVPMMRYLTATHVTGTRPTSDGKPWGDHWQSAHWAQALGRAAWWTWSDLPEDLRRDVRRVVAHEADRFVGLTPPHQIKNDTKAEENAWNSTILDVAVLLMPSDPRRAGWEKEFQRWAMSSYLRPADEHSAKRIDGRPVAEQFTGANIHDDFTLENHGFVHPDYMSCFSLTLWCSLDYAMSGRKPPEALLYNVPEIYENLKWFVLPSGGGIYPSGEDWELFLIPGGMDVHVPMAVFGRDPDAWSLAHRCLETGEKMLARNPRGPLYQPEETYYPGAQEDPMSLFDKVWLALQAAPQIVDRLTERLGVKRWDAGKIMLHRTPAAVHTLSWGARVMAQCIPLRLDFLVSPDPRSGVGHVRLQGSRKILPTILRSAEVADRADGFTADLVLDHGKNGVRAELRFRSDADGTLTVREKLTALRDLTTAEIATGLIGVLNDPKWIFETGGRKIAFDGRLADVPALSGKQVEGEGIKRIRVDEALEIVGAVPLHPRYVGSKIISHGRATDELYLNFLGGQRNWKQGEVISEYEAAVRPVRD